MKLLKKYSPLITLAGKNMVKSNICPVCLADMQGEYIEEGDLRIADEVISCLNCGFTFEGVLDGCPELEELEVGKKKGEGFTKQKAKE